MFAPYNLFAIVLGYLFLLFAVAYYAEKQEKKGKSIVNNPYIYSLSLAHRGYCPLQRVAGCLFLPLS